MLAFRSVRSAQLHSEKLAKRVSQRLWNSQGKRCGHLTETWRRTVANGAKNIGKTWSEVREAQDRTRCKTTVDAVRPSQLSLPSHIRRSVKIYIIIHTSRQIRGEVQLIVIIQKPSLGVAI